MDKIDQRLDNLYRNWHGEYRNAATLEECDEIKRFYQPYLGKYESKHRILYHLLQQPSLISTQETTFGITPSLAALDDAPSLRQREWIQGEPGEDVPQQYSSTGGSRLSQIFWEHANLSGLSVIWLTSTKLH